MAISVALATFNGAAFLREQLNSLAAQTVLPAELVVSDDGSTDDTLAIVRAFAKVAPFPVRILDKTERLGFADNFLYAAEACTGDLVAFCDQDDVWMPEKLERGQSRLERDGSLLAMHTLQTTDQALQPVGLHTQGISGDRVFEALQIDTYRIGWGNSMLFRREIATLLPRGQRPRQMQSDGRALSHDTWIYTVAAALGRVSHIAQPLILYRQHASNVYGVVHRKSRLQNLRDRLITWGSPPVYEMSERKIFYERMAILFDTLQRQTGHTGSLSAAAHFAEHERHMAVRLTLFRAPRLSQRFSAFREARESPGHHRRGLAARTKDLLLGVTGASKLFPTSPGWQ